MKNQDLDTLLEGLRKHEGSVICLHFMEENKDIFERNNYRTIINFLINKGLVKTPSNVVNPNEYLFLTPEGLKFISEGGFSSEEQYKQETLRYAKESRNYAMWGLFVGVTALIVSIVFFLIDLF